MKKALWPWVCWFLFLFGVDFVVPFGVLEDVPKATGSFLFWIIWIIVAIASMFAIFLQWQDHE
jgi:hypothetical protein